MGSMSILAELGKTTHCIVYRNVVRWQPHPFPGFNISGPVLLAQDPSLHHAAVLCTSCPPLPMECHQHIHGRLCCVNKTRHKTERRLFLLTAKRTSISIEFHDLVARDLPDEVIDIQRQSVPGGDMKIEVIPAAMLFHAIHSYFPSLSLTWHFNDPHFICSCSWTRLPMAPTAAFTSRRTPSNRLSASFPANVDWCHTQGLHRLSICFCSSPGKSSDPIFPSAHQ